MRSASLRAYSQTCRRSSTESCLNRWNTILADTVSYEEKLKTGSARYKGNVLR